VKRLVVPLVALAILLAGCKVDTTITVHVERDGSGVVTVDLQLDPEAVRASESGGAKLEDRVRLGDLADAGWKVGAWERTPEGAASLQLSKAFTSPDQVAGIVAEVNGTEGPVRDVRAERDRGVLATSYEVTGAVDLAAMQTGIAADPDLMASLAGQLVDTHAIDQSLLQQVRDALSVKVVVELPDGTTTVQGVAGQNVEIDASSSVRDDRRIFLILLAIGLIVLAVIVFFGGRHSRRRARARGPIPRFDPYGRA